MPLDIEKEAFWTACEEALRPVMEAQSPEVLAWVADTVEAAGWFRDQAALAQQNRYVVKHYTLTVVVPAGDADPTRVDNIALSDLIQAAAYQDGTISGLELDECVAYHYHSDPASVVTAASGYDGAYDVAEDQHAAYFEALAAGETDIAS